MANKNNPGGTGIVVTTVTSSRASRVIRGALCAIALSMATSSGAAEDDERSADAPDMPQEASVAQWIRDGNALLEEGKAREAATRFEEQVKAQPDDAAAHSLLGEALW